MNIVTPVTGTYPPIGGTAETESRAGVPPPAASPAVHDIYINPQIQVDAVSGTVILQYRDDAGKLVRQVPTQYQLRSYRGLQPAAKPQP